jgi:putative copper resistance protein D
MSGAMEGALVAARWVQFASAMMLLGAPAFALGLAWRVPEPLPARRTFDRWLRYALLLAIALAIASAIVWLDLEAAIMGGGWDRAFDTSTLRAVLFSTEFGHAWCWHLGLGCILLATLLIVPFGGLGLGVVLVLGAAFVASLAWAGHAVMHPGITPLVVQTVHLLAGGLWVGSLPALLVWLAQARDGTAGTAAALRRMLSLYARAGYAAVSLVLLTGIANSSFLVDHVGALVTTAFGRVLLAKIALVLLMLGLAARNRMVLTPAAVAEASARPLWRSVALELCLGGLVLGAVSLLGTLPPALRH